MLNRYMLIDRCENSKTRTYRDYFTNRADALQYSDTLWKHMTDESKALRDEYYVLEMDVTPQQWEQIKLGELDPFDYQKCVVKNYK